MLDIFNIPGQQDNVKIFYAGGGTNDWQTWTRPRNCKFIWMMCIGAGSGGFGGAGTGGAPNAPGGPGGAVTRALFPANTLPDTLFIQPGTGSIGGAGATDNTNPVSSVPGRSFVSITPSNAVIMNIVCTSGLANAATSTPETAATISAAGLLSLGNFTSTAGASAAAGGSNLTPLTTTITCAGANGSPAGNVAGASVLSVNLGTFNTPLISGGASGLIGNNGVWYWKPSMFGLGASGGGGVTSGTAGRGGDANSYGCGGAGGGNSGAGTGGNGGKGGDGLVIIATF
jgi:hypothetical protein